MMHQYSPASPQSSVLLVPPASLRDPQSDAPGLLSAPYSMLAGASVARALSARRLLHFAQMKAAALRDGNL